MLNTQYAHKMIVFGSISPGTLCLPLGGFNFAHWRSHVELSRSKK